MDYTQLIQLIDANGGDDCVMAIIYDNTCRSIYSREKPFNRTEDIQNQFFIRNNEHDDRGVPFISYKPIETIQSVIFVADGDVSIKDKIDIRYIL